jgi:hypothetical protein
LTSKSVSFMHQRALRLPRYTTKRIAKRCRAASGIRRRRHFLQISSTCHLACANTHHAHTHLQQHQRLHPRRCQRHRLQLPHQRFQRALQRPRLLMHQRTLQQQHQYQHRQQHPRHPQQHPLRRQHTFPPRRQPEHQPKHPQLLRRRWYQPQHQPTSHRLALQRRFRPVLRVAVVAVAVG